MWPHPLSPRTHTLFPYTTLFRSTAVELGLIGKADPIVIQLYSEPLQRFRLAAEGHGTVQPPEQHRERVARYFDPLPFWYPPFERSEEHTSELQSLMRISYAVFCLKKKKN